MGRKPNHSGFRFIRLTTTASTNTTRPTMRPRTTAVIVPEARPISQPPASAGVPHCGFLLFPMRMAQNTVSGIATATKRAARQPIPKPVEAGLGFRLLESSYAMSRPGFALRKRGGTPEQRSITLPSWLSAARAARDVDDYSGVTRPSSGADAGASAVQARRPRVQPPPGPARQPRRSAGKRRTGRDAHRDRNLPRPVHRNLRTTIVQQLMLPTGLFCAFALSFCGLAATRRQKHHMPDVRMLKAAFECYS